MSDGLETGVLPVDCSVAVVGVSVGVDDGVLSGVDTGVSTGVLDGELADELGDSDWGDDDAAAEEELSGVEVG